MNLNVRRPGVRLSLKGRWRSEMRRVGLTFVRDLCVRCRRKEKKNVWEHEWQAAWKHSRCITYWQILIFESYPWSVSPSGRWTDAAAVSLSSSRGFLLRGCCETSRPEEVKSPRSSKLFGCFGVKINPDLTTNIKVTVWTDMSDVSPQAARLLWLNLSISISGRVSTGRISLTETWTRGPLTSAHTGAVRIYSSSAEWIQPAVLARLQLTMSNSGRVSRINERLNSYTGLSNNTLIIGGIWFRKSMKRSGFVFHPALHTSAH